MINTIQKEHQYYRKLEKISDRCDRCGATAYIRAVKLVNGQLLELLLCSHHFKPAAYQLGRDDWWIQNDQNND